jgi:hypothetical protein
MAIGNRDLPGFRLVFAAFAATGAATVLLLVLPVYSSGASLIEVNGLSAAWVLLLPVAVSALPLWVGGGRAALLVRLVATLLLVGFVVVGVMSVGAFYLPGAVLMGISALWLAKMPPARVA